MAKNRMINTKFWSDGWIINLDPLERYLYLYFLTNEHTNICGIYELPLRIIGRESGIEDEMVTKMLKKMSEKITYIDGWIQIKNFLKHQKTSGNVKLGIENGLKEVPPQILAKLKDNLDIGGTQGTHSLKLELESELESEYKENPKSSRFTPPSLIAVSEYITRMKFGLDPQEFMDVNEAKGWVVGKVRMKDWEAAVRTFERNRIKWGKDKPAEISERRII